MPLKVRIQFVHALKALPAAQKEFTSRAIDVLGPVIDSQIGGGQSPVKGEGRYAQYQPSYEDKIDNEEGIIKGSDGQFYSGKRKRPVNLSVSGATRKSQSVKASGDGLTISYDSKIAVYLNGGTKKMTARPILPTRPGELFSNTITRLLNFIAYDAIDKILRRR